MKEGKNPKESIREPLKHAIFVFTYLVSKKDSMNTYKRITQFILTLLV